MTGAIQAIGMFAAADFGALLIILARIEGKPFKHLASPAGMLLVYFGVFGLVGILGASPISAAFFGVLAIVATKIFAWLIL